MWFRFHKFKFLSKGLAWAVLWLGLSGAAVLAQGGGVLRGVLFDIDDAMKGYVGGFWFVGSTAGRLHIGASRGCGLGVEPGVAGPMMEHVSFTV